MIQNFEILNLNATIFAVNKKYVDNKIGGRIRVCRIKTYQNVGGSILPVLVEKGNVKEEISLNSHYLYMELSDAINAIRTKK